MKDLLKKSVLSVGLLLITNSLFAQPGPPPGPPIPVLITNNTEGVIVIKAIEKDDCNGFNSASTSYTISQGATLQLYHTIASTNATTAYWLGIAAYWWTSTPTSMTTVGNPYTNCVVLPFNSAPGQPQLDWTSQYNMEIY